MEWHDSAHKAAVLAQANWIRMVANMSNGAYDIFEASGKLPDPEWPDLAFSEILRIAFRDFRISSTDHPVIRKLWGVL